MLWGRRLWAIDSSLLRLKRIFRNFFVYSRIQHEIMMYSFCCIVLSSSQYCREPLKAVETLFNQFFNDFFLETRLYVESSLNESVMLPQFSLFTFPSRTWSLKGVINLQPPSLKMITSLIEMGWLIYFFSWRARSKVLLKASFILKEWKKFWNSHVEAHHHLQSIFALPPVSKKVCGRCGS